MKSGFVFHEFTSVLFFQIERQEMWYEEHGMNNILQEILANVHEFGSELLVVDANVPNSMTHDTSINVLEYLKLSYSPPWPVSIVIDSTSIAEYNKVFTLLVQIKRAKSALDNMGTCKNTPRNHVFHSLVVLRTKLLQFVNNLQNYIVNRVLQSVWLEFKEELMHAKDLDHVCQLHTTYLANIRDRCLLNTKASLVMNTIKKILNLCLKFKVIFEDGLSSSVSLANKKKVLQDYSKLNSEFEQAAAFLITVITKIVSQKKLNHLDDLLQRLNFNLYYSKQVPHISASVNLM